MDVTNVSSETFEAEFFTSFLMEGSFSVFENGASASLGNLTQQLVLEAQTMAPDMDHHVYHAIHGGSFWSGLKSFLRKAAQGVEKLAPVVASVAPQFGPVASAVGTLAKEGRKALGGSRLSGGRLQGRRRR